MFLANENFPFPSIEFLRKQGLDILSIGEKFCGISDEKVLKMAVDLKRIILTFDRHYGELIYKFQKEAPPAVLYFRSKGTGPNSAGIILWELLQNQDFKVEGYFTVIEDNAIRQRKL